MLVGSFGIVLTQAAAFLDLAGAILPKDKKKPASFLSLLYNTLSGLLDW